MANVNELRKQGKLDEALELALIELNEKPHDIWANRNIAWVYYALCKKADEEKNINSAIEYIDKIVELQLDSSETMLFNSLIWRIVNILYIINDIDSEKSKKLLTTIFDEKGYHLTKPSKEYSLLLKIINKAKTNHLQFVDLCNKWDLANLQPEDFVEPLGKDGKKTISIGEQILLNYGKALIALNNQDKTNPTIIESITTFLTVLDSAIAKYNHTTWLAYMKIKLLIQTNSIDEQSIEQILPLAQKKKKEFWIWDLLSQIYSKDETLSLACLIRAAHCPSKNEFLVGLHEKLADELIKRGDYSAAKYYAKKCIETKLEKGQITTIQNKKWCDTDWYNNTNESKEISIKCDYQNLTNNILLGNKPELLFIITGINQQKNIINVCYGIEQNGFLSYKNIIQTPQIGEFYKAKIDQLPANGEQYIKALSAEKQDQIYNTDFHLITSGSLSITSKGFGFITAVDSNGNSIKIFVPIDLIKSNIEHTKTIKCIALLTRDKTKNILGWKAIKIE